jgi:hypothetical protein
MDGLGKQEMLLVERLLVDQAGDNSLACQLKINSAQAAALQVIVADNFRLCWYCFEYLSYSSCCCNLIVHSWHGVGDGGCKPKKSAEWVVCCNCSMTACLQIRPRLSASSGSAARHEQTLKHDKQALI